MRALVGLLLLGLVTLVGPGSTTSAVFTDSSSVSTGPLSALSVAPSPSFACGAVGVLSVSFSWTAVAGATSYTLHYGSGGSSTLTTTNTSATITSAISSGTAWVVTNRNFGSVTWTSAPSNQRTYTVALASFCG